MILLILTSHRLDCFALCLKCLEANTDLRAFKKIYVLGNELAPAHKEHAAAFAGRHANAELVEFGPRGWLPLMETQDRLLRQHPDSITVKIDEDVFVMPKWLDAMLLEYHNGQRNGCVLVSALVPNNQSGLRMLHDAYLEKFPEYSKIAETAFKLPISKNPSYALWLWSKFLQGKLDLSPEGLLSNVCSRKVDFYLNINCIMVNPVFLQAVLPFSGSTDELLLNHALQMDAKVHAMVTPRAVAHHYSFGPQQEVLDRHIRMEDLEPLLLSGGRLPEANSDGGGPVRGFGGLTADTLISDCRILQFSS